MFHPKSTIKPAMIQNYALRTIRQFSSVRGYALKNPFLEIHWKDNSKKLHFQWLRDHCPCPKCIHPSNRQKLHRSADVNLVIPKVEMTDGLLQIMWPEKSLLTTDEEHKSIFSLDFLKNLPYPDSRSYAGKTWNQELLSKSQLQFDYKETFAAPSKFNRLLKQLYDYGIAFISNAPINNSQVEKLGQSFGNIRETFYGILYNIIIRENLGRKKRPECQKYCVY